MQLTYLILHSLVLFVSVSFVSCKTYHISPTLESCSGHGQFCLTISQFAANSSQYLESNTALVLPEGNHTLETQLTVEGIKAFSMHSSAASVTCENSTFYLLNVTDVQLFNVTFRGCRIKVVSVSSMVVGGNRFTDFDVINGSCIVLEIIETNASITNTAFSNINVSSNNLFHCGILEANRSHVRVRGSLFGDNRASYGLTFYRSELIITHSSFRDNKISSSSLRLTSMENKTIYIGGILRFGSLCNATISHCNFTNNNLGNFSE